MSARDEVFIPAKEELTTSSRVCGFAVVMICKEKTLTIISAKQKYENVTEFGEKHCFAPAKQRNNFMNCILRM